MSTTPASSSPDAVSTKSNDNGRALESLITTELEKVEFIELTQRTLDAQRRDDPKVKVLDLNLSKSFQKSAKLITDWIISEIGTNHGLAVEVDRSSDNDAGVADINITYRDKLLPLSVKHNHDALSHARPYSLFKSSGFGKSTSDTAHRDALAKACNSFRLKAGSAKLFSEVANLLPELYVDVCQACTKSIETFPDQSLLAEKLFSFLVGPGCKKVIVRTKSTHTLKRIEIFDYSALKKPTKVTPTFEKRTQSASLVLVFDNGWEIDLRVHSASSLISVNGQLSLKFDVQRKAGILPDPIVLFG